MSHYPGITARFRLDNPDAAIATLTVSMPVKQWRSIAAKLSTGVYEEWPLRSAIMDLIRQAETVFYKREPDDNG